MISSKGFTLVELMVVIGIIAFITAIGVPTFSNVIADNRLTSTANSLVGALQIARSEAVTQHTVIKVCATNADKTGCGDSTNWSDGALIMRGTNLVKFVPSSNKGVTVTSSRNDIEYQGNGTTTAATISIKDTREETRSIKVNAIGQACSGSTCS